MREDGESEAVVREEQNEVGEEPGKCGNTETEARARQKWFMTSP